MNADEQQIRDLIATWLAASEAGDINRVLGMMTEDVVFLRPGQPPMRGRDAYAKASGANGQPLPFSIKGLADIQEVEVSGHLAYCWNHLTITMIPKDGGEAKTRAGHVLTVFRKDTDGHWRLLRDANMLA